jgi:hypothetical protein
VAEDRPKLFAVMVLRDYGHGDSISTSRGYTVQSRLALLACRDLLRSQYYLVRIRLLGLGLPIFCLS